MSKPMPLNVFAKKVGIDKKEQQWIMDNDKDDHYINNSALKNAWTSLSYPIYDGDYYFAFINDSARVSAQQNAKMNRKLRELAGSKLDAEGIYKELYKYGEMHAKGSGLSDTMTREELWRAVVDIRQKNPVKEEVVSEGMKMKDIMRKHKRELNKAYKSGDLSFMSSAGKKAENDLMQWAMDNGEVKTDDPDDFFDWLSRDLEDIVKGKIKEDVNVMDTYREMWEDAGNLNEEVANITVDPRNKISKPADQNKHAMEITKQAKRFGLKSSMMGKHVRLKGNKKAVNDFLRIIIGKSSYGDPTEKDTSTPQIDKMLTKELK